MKRILVYGMTDNKGGIESYVMNVFHNLDKNILTFDFVTDFPEMAYADEVIAGGSKVYKIPAKSKHPVKQITKFYKLLKSHPEYDTVYFNILNAGGAYNMLAAKMLHRKIIVHSHNSSDDNMLLHKLFKPLLNSFADKKIACSSLAADFMFNKNDDVSILINAIDATLFAFNEESRARTRKKLNIENRKVVTSVGRLAPQKNPFFLMDIAKQLHAIDESVLLLHVGTGPLENEVKEYAKKIGVSDNVIFTGMRDDIPDLLNASDCFLLPSKYEGFGVAILEAQANGLHCFASKDVVVAESNVNGLVQFISLEASAKSWAETILSTMAVETDRASYANSLAGTGCVIGELVTTLSDLLI